MLRHLFVLTLPAAFVGTALAMPAHAASEDAWHAFRTDVREKCTALAEVPPGGNVHVAVNPFGSSTFGAAIVTVTLADGTADKMVCIYDKQAKTAEMTAPFNPADLADAGNGASPTPEQVTPVADGADKAAEKRADKAKGPKKPKSNKGTCDAKSYRDQIGKPESEIAVPEGANVRKITPEMMVTEDYQKDRINLHFGTDGLLSDVTCG